MTKVSSLLRYFLYYVAIYIMVSMFIGWGIKPFALYLCTRAIGISFLAALVGTFYNSNMLSRIEDLCLKAPFVAVGVIVFIQIAFEKIELF